MNLGKSMSATRTVLVSLGAMTLLGLVTFTAAPASAEDGDVLDAVDCIDLGAILPLPIGCLLPSETPTDPSTPTVPSPPDAPADPSPTVPTPATPSPTAQSPAVRSPIEGWPAEHSAPLAQRGAQVYEPSATVIVDCAGFVATLDNTSSSEATDFTLLPPTGIEEAVTVEAGDSLVMTYPVVEGKTATVKVFAGGYQLAEASFTANCVPTSSPGEPDQRGEPAEPSQPNEPNEPSGLLPSTGAIASARLVALASCLIAVGGSLVRAATRRA